MGDSLVILLLAERAALERKRELPDYPSCSLSPHDETVVAQCACERRSGDSPIVEIDGP